MDAAEREIREAVRWHKWERELLECDPLVLKDAIEELAPSAGQRRECESQVRRMLVWVQHHRHVRRWRTPARARAQYREIAKALGTLNHALHGSGGVWHESVVGGSWSREEIEKKRALFEQLANGIPSKRSGPQRGRVGKGCAVHAARKLLIKYGHKPTRTRDGKWHTLAWILYDDPKADLFQAVLDYEEPARG